MLAASSPQNDGFHEPRNEVSAARPPSDEATAAPPADRRKGVCSDSTGDPVTRSWLVLTEVFPLILRTARTALWCHIGVNSGSQTQHNEMLNLGPFLLRIHTGIELFAPFRGIETVTANPAGRADLSTLGRLLMLTEPPALPTIA